MREHILRAERISAIDQMETEEGKDKSLSSSIIQQLEDVLEKAQLERLHCFANNMIASRYFLNSPATSSSSSAISPGDGARRSHLC